MRGTLEEKLDGVCRRKHHLGSEEKGRISLLIPMLPMLPVLPLPTRDVSTRGERARQTIFFFYGVRCVLGLTRQRMRLYLGEYSIRYPLRREPDAERSSPSSDPASMMLPKPFVS